MERWIVVKVWRGILDSFEEFATEAEANAMAEDYSANPDNAAGVIRIETDGSTLTIEEA